MSPRITIYGPTGDALRLKADCYLFCDVRTGNWFIRYYTADNPKQPNLVSLPPSFLSGSATKEEFETLRKNVQQANLEEET